MVASIMKEEEFFFESLDYMSGEMETDYESKELFYGESEYEIWTIEPQSVQERRERFIQGMGMSETSSDTKAILECTTEFKFNDKESRFNALDSICVRENPLFSKELETEDEEISCSKSLESEKSDVASAGSSERVPKPLSFMLEYEFKEEDNHSKKKKRNWLDLLLARNTMKGGKLKPIRMTVSPEHKKNIEYSAVYVQQKIKAHSGCIRVMKISIDGRYLASGGDDGVIRIWLIKSAGGEDLKIGKLRDGTKSVSTHVLPEKLFHIEEHPLYEYFGHSGCVVDLTWSKSNNYLVSSSKDGTARLWRIGMASCLNVFHHNNPVTCVQFHPIADDYFISGSLDGKVRIWGTFKGRVTDWIDIREAVTAICYQPDGTGFIVGSSLGICHFYGHSGDIQLEAQMQIHGKKKTPSSKITSITFSPDEIHRIMITSNDSVVRILDGVNVIYKYKGIRRSSAQLSASFTSNGRRIISLDADSRIYIWNYDGTPSPSRKSSKNVCEHFLLKDVSVAIPLLPVQTDQDSTFSFKKGHVLDSMSLSSGSWLSSARGSTWPDDLVPSSDWDVPITQCPSISSYHSFPTDHAKSSAVSETRGVMIVTASRDGVLRTFHKYGLPTNTG